MICELDIMVYARADPGILVRGGGRGFFFRSMGFWVPFWSPMGTRQHLHVVGGPGGEAPGGS